MEAIQEPREDIDLISRHRNSVFHTGGSMGSTSVLVLCLDHNHATAIIKNVDGDRSANLLGLALRTLDLSLSTTY